MVVGIIIGLILYCRICNPVINSKHDGVPDWKNKATIVFLLIGAFFGLAGTLFDISILNGICVGLSFPLILYEVFDL